MLSCRGLRKTYQTDRGPVDAVRGADLDAVSYTHLDVYKRQIQMRIHILTHNPKS